MSNTRAIEGKDVLVRAKKTIDDVAVLIPFVCSTTIDFTYTRDLITKTTVSSGKFREYAYGLGEWGFTLGTITHVKPKTEMYTVFDMMELMKGGQSLDVELSFIDAEGNAITLSGTVLIPSVGISSPVEDFSEDDLEFKGSGAFEITKEVITTDPGGSTGDYVRDGIRPLNIDTDVETNVITNTQLAGKNVFEVLVDGIGKKIITVGDPDDKQVKYLTDGGSLIFSYALPVGTWVLVLYT